MKVGVAEARVAVALWEALDLVLAGWTQGAYYRTETGNACERENAYRVDLAGALQIAADNNGVDVEALRARVSEHMDARYRRDMLGVERWNDFRYRGKRDVVLLLQRAIGVL